MKDLNYQLGYQCGYKVIFEMNTLSVDMMQNNVINVSIEEETKHKELFTLWLDKCKSTEDSKSDWSNLKEFKKELNFKYLPNPFEVVFKYLHFTNKSKFLKGLIDYLWDTDYFTYSLEKENIEIIEEDIYTTIIFKLK
jgi:hypothetical protein